MPPFFEPDFREPPLDLFVEEVLLDAAAARLVEPEPFLAEDLVPADFAPPRAEDADFLAPDERALDSEPDFEPPFAVDLEADLEAAFEPDFDALFFPPLFADDFFEALFEAPPEDLFAAVFFEDEAPLFAEDFVPFRELDEPLEPPRFVELEVVEPPDEPALFV